MYCVKCGNELPDDANFCVRCGTSVNNSINQTNSNQQYVGAKNTNETLSSVKNVFSNFFSKEPLSAFKVAKTITVSGIIFIAYLVLFCLITNLNIIQIVKTIITYFFDEIESRIGQSISMPDMQLGIVQGFIVPFLLMGFAIIVIDLIGAYVILRLKGVSKDFFAIINQVSISFLPFIIGLLINLIIGFICAPVIIGILIASAIIHIIFLYAAIKNLLGTDYEPLREYSIFILIVYFLLGIAVAILIKQGVTSAIDAVESYLKSMVMDVFSNFSLF